ncbi:MAG: hypothetical protein PF447_01505 [Spirochaetaceae bacterium]|jgi:flagellar motor switch protein FliG|nr:hypothetical protein [Spirochaetaceae bacterium]
MAFSNNPIEQYKRIQSMDQSKEDPAFEKITQENRLRRVAKFVLLIGKEQATQVFSHLPEQEIQQICEEMAFIKEIQKDEARDILQEFGVRLETEPRLPQDSFNSAQDILEQTLGKDKAKELLKKAQPEKFSGPFSFLDDVELPQLLHLLKDESPVVLSFLLPQLKKQRAAELLKAQTKDVQLELIKRLGRMEKIDPMVLEITSETLKKKLNHQGKWESQEWDGKSVLADILKHMDATSEDNILKDLSVNDEQLTEEVREKLLTMDLIFRLREKDLQKLLQSFSEKDIALLLKLKDQEVQDKILSNLSQRRQEMILSEITIIGQVRKSDVHNITRRFLEELKRQEEQGLLILINPLEEYL